MEEASEGTRFGKNLKNWQEPQEDQNQFKTYYKNHMYRELYKTYFRITSRTFQELQAQELPKTRRTL